MIKTEIVEINGRNLVKSYSDKGFKIMQNETGIVYDSAVDVDGSPFTYSESEIVSEEYELTNEEAYNIIIGVSE